MEDCLFCQIVKGEIPTHLIDENEDVIVFMDLKNYPLIATKKHVKNLYELDEKLGAAAMKEAIKIAKAVKNGLNADGVNLIQNNEPVAGQSVFHFHLHVKPRWENDDFILHFPENEAESEERKETADKIRQALE